MFGAGTAPEHSALDLEPGGFGVQFNIAVNNRCDLAPRCGKHCILGQVQPVAPELPLEVSSRAFHEVVRGGRTVRFMTLCEKEVLDTPARLAGILECYHSTCRLNRPQSLGILTNGVSLLENLPLLLELPPDWCLVSLDGLAPSHRRGVDAWEAAFQGLVALRDSGACRLVGANTVVTTENLESVISLGHLLESEHIQYWGLGVYLNVNGDGNVVSMIGHEQTRGAILRVVEEFADSQMAVVFEIEPEVFEQLSGTSLECVTAGPWRLEHAIAGTSVRIATVSPVPGRWLRLRSDGQLIDKSDLLRIGVIDGRYGRYEPGKITRMLQRIHDTWDSPSRCPASLLGAAAGPGAGK